MEHIQPGLSRELQARIDAGKIVKDNQEKWHNSTTLARKVRQIWMRLCSDLHTGEQFKHNGMNGGVASERPLAIRCPNIGQALHSLLSYVAISWH